jgi:adenylosuccinate synthase
VGEGPFPTELFDDTGKRIAETGAEFGATTGRPRRCGWLDLVALKYAVIINGVTELVITKSDVLENFGDIKAAVGYEINGEVTEKFPSNPCFLQNAKPLYKSFKGWGKIRGVGEYEKLPDEFRNYISFIENYVNVPVKYVSTGASRADIIVR